MMSNWAVLPSTGGITTRVRGRLVIGCSAGSANPHPPARRAHAPTAATRYGNPRLTRAPVRAVKIALRNLPDRSKARPNRTPWRSGAQAARYRAHRMSGTDVLASMRDLPDRLLAVTD